MPFTVYAASLQSNILVMGAGTRTSELATQFIFLVTTRVGHRLFVESWRAVGGLGSGEGVCVVSSLGPQPGLGGPGSKLQVSPKRLASEKRDDKRQPKYAKKINNIKLYRTLFLHTYHDIPGTS